MNKEDTKFLHGKGHICNYCDFNKDLCYNVKYIKDYARKERNINEMSIQIFNCSLFTRRNK